MSHRQGAESQSRDTIENHKWSSPQGPFHGAAEGSRLGDVRTPIARDHPPTSRAAAVAPLASKRQRSVAHSRNLEPAMTPSKRVKVSPLAKVAMSRVGPANIEPLVVALVDAVRQDDETKAVAAMSR